MGGGSSAGEHATDEAAWLATGSSFRRQPLDDASPDGAPFKLFSGARRTMMPQTTKTMSDPVSRCAGCIAYQG
jgi:hypothetical protein